MTFLLVVAGAILAVWLLRKNWSGKRGVPSSFSPPVPAPAPAPAPAAARTQRVVEVQWPTLPNDGEQAIVRALQAGEEPPTDWQTGTWNARHQKVVGESFENPNGTSRQEILKNARPGQRVYLVPEPTNQYDPGAVAVYLDTGGGSTAQIGYLPRDAYLKDDVGVSAIGAWIAAVRQPEGTKNRGTALYIAWDEDRTGARRR